MKKTFKLFTLFILLALLLMPTTSAYAQGPNPGGGGRVIFGSNYTVKSGETFDGDLVVFGGNVTIEEDANLNGAAPNITLPNGRIPPDVPPPHINPNFTLFWAPVKILFRAIAVALLAMLVMMFLQPQIEHVGQAITKQPFMAGGVGLITVLGAPLVIFIVALVMAVTLILIPMAIVVALLGVLTITLAWLFGMIALGQEIGDRFTRSINQNWAPVFTAGFGTFLLMLVGGAIGEIPCVGWLATALIGLLGIGAVVITRFGMRPVQTPTMTIYTPTPPADSGQVPPAS